jgi:predicted O-linked N-acetylglucosamine transferase (SPINDLY family)
MPDPAAIDPPQTRIDALMTALATRRLDHARALAEDLTAQFRDSALALNWLGAVCLEQRDWGAARDAWQACLVLAPDHPPTLGNLGLALVGLGQIEAAIAAYRAALAIDRAQPMVHANLGDALQAQGRFDAAAEAYARALAIDPGYAHAAVSQGVALQRAGRPEAAIAAYRRCLAIAPEHRAARSNLGNALCEAGHDSQAIAVLTPLIAAGGAPVEAWLNLGSALRRLNRADEAAAVYACALAQAPHDPRPRDGARLQAGLGHALSALNRHGEAIAAYRRSLALAPGQARVAAYCLHEIALVCDWDAPAPAVPDPGECPDDPADPFALLACEDDPARQLRRSRAWAASQSPRVAPDRPDPAPRADGRLAIGYVSADFHDHATMHLIAGLLREHDRRRFAVHAYSLGRPSEDAMRAHLAAYVDSLADLSAATEADSVARMRADGIAVAVDLSRTRFFARRPAPVQVAWLGYPGSMGSPAYDYLIADAIVIENPADYDERIVTLAGSYQPNDNRRAIAQPGTRADHGLPNGAFVFCCFNQSYKIAPAVFAIWMRLLRTVPGSVLWLYAGNDQVAPHLRAQAQRHGIDPARLVFAGTLPQAEHLGRHVHADLFLDTFAVNAHTTASDALWAGLPVLTMAGRQFAARVGASLLHAVGLPDLVTHDPAAYEARALALATDPAALAEVRARLAANRLTHPLFDTPAFARRIEAAYATIWARHAAGLPPAAMTVA